MNKILSVLLLSLCCSALPCPAQAADSPQEEITYRASLGRADDVKLLIKEGASPNQKDENGTPIIALAAERLDDEGPHVIDDILAAGGNINEPDAQGQTALFYAAKRGNAAMVKYLLSKGINYYAKDNDGDIARTIAYNAKHPEIVDLMDKFVNDQTEVVKHQYQSANAVLEERYRAIENANTAVASAASAVVAAQASAKAQAEAEANSASAVPPPPTQEELAAKKKAAQAAEAKRKEAETERLKAIKRDSPDLAFNTCAYQYWSFCRDAKQSTELSEDELVQTIQSLKDKLQALDDKLSKEDKDDNGHIDKVAESAEKRIYNQLNAMPSNIARHENGIGKKKDMQTRCQEIADSWELDAPITPASQAETTSSGSNAANTQTPMQAERNSAPVPSHTPLLNNSVANPGNNNVTANGPHPSQTILNNMRRGMSPPAPTQTGQ